MSNQGDNNRRDPKKPGAIIDLKATEVRDAKPKGAPSQATAASTPAAGAPTATAQALKAAAGRAGTKPGGTSTGPAAASSSTASAAAATKAGATAAQAAANDKSGASPAQSAASSAAAKPAAAAPPEKSGSGWLGTISHLAAAVIGGGIVLLGGDQLAQQAGIPLPKRAVEVPAELTQRLAALEELTKAPASALPADVTAKLALVESQAATIASLSKTVDELRNGQSAVLAAAEKVTTTAEGGTAGITEDVAKRLASLEQTIATLSKAAGEEGTSGGRIAQIAALSGKLTDLEATLKTQLSTLRESVMADVDGRISPTAEASEAARSGAERIDRELAETKTELARVAQKTEALSAKADLLDKSVRAAQEETGRVTTAVEALQGDLKQQIAGVAKPADITAAVQPITEKVASIETDLKGVVSSEAARKENAERVVLALQLANLRRALDRGGSFETELDAVKSLAGDRIDVSSLERFKSEGVTTTSVLTSEFRVLGHDMISAASADPDASWMDKMVAGAKSIVRVRRTGEPAGLDPNSTEAIVATIERHLKSGDLTSAAAAADQLPDAAKATAKDWLSRLKARAAVDTAIAAIEGELKSSIAGGEQGKKG